MQYEGSITSGLKIRGKVKVFLKVGQTSRSRSQCKNTWCHVKDLFTRNTHMQYESSTTSGLKDKAKVKVFVHATDADGRAATRTYLSRIAKKANI